MGSHFYNAIIENTKRIYNAHTEFDKIWNEKMNLFEAEQGTEAQSKQETDPAASPVPNDQEALPTKSDVASIGLTELAVAALFVELPDLEKKHPEIKEAINNLSRLKPVAPEEVPYALRTVRKIVGLYGINSNFNIGGDTEDFTSQSILVNTIVNCLFASKDKMQTSDPSTGPLLKSISDNHEQLKTLKNTDIVGAVESARKIQKSLDSMLATSLVP